MTLSDERLDELWEIAIRDDACKQLVPSDIRGLVIAARRVKELEADLKAALDRNCQHVEELTRTETERDALLCLADETDATAKNLAADNARLREVLSDADRAIEASYVQAHAEWQRHDSVEAKQDAIIRDWKDDRDKALASTPEQSEDPAEEDLFEPLLPKEGDTLKCFRAEDLAAHDAAVRNAALEEAAQRAKQFHLYVTTGSPNDQAIGEAIGEKILKLRSNVLKTEPDND